MQQKRQINQFEAFDNATHFRNEGTGYEFNDAGITFWDDLDDYEKANEDPFKVECFVLDDACRLTYEEFGFYVGMACERFGACFPTKKSEVEALADAYAFRLKKSGIVSSLPK